jgi:superfamily II DNA or RNA helicase
VFAFAQHLTNTTVSFRAGNCGINLTQENRVFLMEPGFNPALEQQAIGRVHRLGQKRIVEVVRLLVRDSVETRIHTFLKKKNGDSSTDDYSSEDPEKHVDSTICPVGNVATEKPKSEILADEFDILFGVNASESTNSEKSENEGNFYELDMLEAAIREGFV